MSNMLTLNELAGLMMANADSRLDQAEMERFIQLFFNNIGVALRSQQRVTIDGFGTFTLMGDGETKVCFIPDRDFADTVNEPFSFFEAEELDDRYEETGEEPTDEAEPTVAEPVVVAETANEEEPVADDEISVTATEAVEEVIEKPLKKGEPTINEEPENKEEPKIVEGLKADEETKMTDGSTDCAAEKEVKAESLKITEEKIKGPTREMARDADEEAADESVEHETERQSWHMPWWIPGLVGLFVGFAIGYGFNLVSLPAPEDYDEEEYAEEEPAEITEAEAVEVTEFAVVSDSSAVETTGVAEAPEVVKSEEPAVKPESDRAVKPLTDTIRKNYFLTSMAGKYYGNKNFWVYIYEENKAKLNHPDRIPQGTEVVIPPAEKYGIDQDDPASVKAATAKISEIYARFKK